MATSTWESGHVQAVNALQEALLIKAQSRIVQLESEVSRLTQEALVEKLKQDFSSATREMTVTYVERQHQVYCR